jgi:hypothetical protein
VVAQTLSAIEAAWIDAGFPDGPAFQAIVSAALSASAIRPQS